MSIFDGTAAGVENIKQLWKTLANLIKQLIGDVDLTKGDLQTQINNNNKDFIKSGSSAKSGLVPAPPTTVGTSKYLREDGTWQTPPDTDTWRGIQNNLTSGSASDSLAAAQGKVLKELIDEVKSLRATLNAYGLVKVTDSSAVTDSTGLALAATEKNASISGTLANQISQLNTDYDPLSVKNVTYPNCYAGYDDNNQVKCMKLNNGMRCITGCMKVISTVSIDTYTLFTVPDDFSLSNIKGIPYQKWITVTNISQKKAYNCLFVGNVISVWFTDNERPSVYDYLSIHLIY